MTDINHERVAIQDSGIPSHCWACGPGNELGLQIKSYWTGEEAVCNFYPRPEHMAGPGILNGGIIASIIDCHSLAAATAATYHAENREIGSDPQIQYVTGTITVTYVRPTPMQDGVQLRARVTELGKRKAVVECTLVADDQECARGVVIGVRVRTDEGD